MPLLLYNHYAFHSWTHLAYSDVPRQQKGFFGIGAPSLKVLATLLFDSRGLLTISPVLIMGAIGTVLLYRRGRRAEALTIGGICLCYVGYNSGYYLPFGGGFMGPRFLTTMLPFLAFPIALALKRFPAPTIALAAVSITTTVIATITHPLVGYENETVIWTRYPARRATSSRRSPPPTDSGAAGAASGRSSWPPAGGLVAGGAGDAAPAAATCSARLAAARAARLGAVRGARADRAGDRPPGPAQHRRRRRQDGAEPEAAQRQPLPADAASRRSPPPPGCSRAAAAARLLRNGERERPPALRGCRAERGIGRARAPRRD